MKKEITKGKILEGIISGTYSIVAVCTAFVFMIITLFAFSFIFNYFDIPMSMFWKFMMLGAIVGVYFGVYIGLMLIFNKAYREYKKIYLKRKKERELKKSRTRGMTRRWIWGG